MFVGMGISAIFPVLDGLGTFGVKIMEMQIGLSWLVLQGALYIFGAGLYAVSVRSQSLPPRHSQNLPTGSNPGSMVSWQIR